MGKWPSESRQPRIRGRALQTIRANHFRRFPLCVMCEAKGRVTMATELDHRKPLHQGGTDTPDNRQSLCADCHLEKSITERGDKLKRKIGADGYPVVE